MTSAAAARLADDESLVDLRCSVAVIHGEEILLVDPARCAFVGEVIGPVDALRSLHLRPPIAGYLPALISGNRGIAAYLGNLWRPPRDGSP